MSVALLVVGYLLAVPPLPFLRRILRERRYYVAAVESAGAFMITAGWLMRGGTLAVVINGAWLLIWTSLWVVARQRARHDPR
ncbi:MAG TPA: hypothetical protein VFZ12_00085 [Dehalococcoidia bacterium]|nr:hypothetical protein [Dehalococcoidia bacterium]